MCIAHTLYLSLYQQICTSTRAPGILNFSTTATSLSTDFVDSETKVESITGFAFCLKAVHTEKYTHYRVTYNKITLGIG